MKDRLHIKGGTRLKGEVHISGAKNSAVAIIPAALLAKDICVIENLPEIDDAKVLKTLLEDIGCVVDYEDRTMTIDSRNIISYFPDGELSQKLRASYYFLGALLGRYKKASVAFPGGCSIGNRPIDLHIKGFEALGAKIDIEHGSIYAKADKLIGASIFMDVVSVGATINIMLASVMADGVTTIENAAKEPHVVDVANFLNSMGAKVKGAGTDLIKITGVSELHGSTYAIIPDQIEAGTYMIAAAVTNGDVKVSNIIPKHMESISAKLGEMGVQLEEGDDYIRVRGYSKLVHTSIKTSPYPGFPTDLQQPMGVLMCLAEGTSIISEGIWESRFRYIDELKRMGAKAQVEGKTAIIEGVGGLTGSLVRSNDLRAGAALVVAGLVAKGDTYVENIHHIDRGYEKIEEKLCQLGANITRLKGDETN